MELEKKYIQDERVQQILDMILKFLKFDFNARSSFSEGKDELDAIIVGLNTLGEEIAGKLSYIEGSKQKTNEIVEVLLKFTMMDFSQRIVVSENRDELDAIALGLNTLGEELENNIKQLKESERRFRLVVENVKDFAIIRLDANGFIQSWNIGAERINGYSAKEIIGKHISVLYTEDDIISKEPERDLKIAKEEGRFESEGWRVRKDGAKFFADVILTAMYDENNAFQGYSQITRDVTKRRKAESEIKQKSEELFHTNKELVLQIEEKEKRTKELIMSNKQLEQFVFIASHDLQEPLQTISNFVGLIDKKISGKCGTDTNQYLEFVLAATSKMQNLIKDLLDYSRLEMPTTFLAVDCNAVLKEVLDEMGASIKESNAKITATDLPVIIGNKIQLKQVFKNLISNAIKFHRKNVLPEIEITVKEKDTEYVFSIKDNGIGIEQQDIGKLFVVFKRLHNASEYEGNGIGLAIAQKIIAHHNGKIWIESKFGEGSTFYFTLPKEKK
ncbi:MAG: ATP-binding protein [Bacteroidia bacterium]|nr:ATP-binding protein [Bacteroidia bacterium]